MAARQTHYLPQYELKRARNSSHDYLARLAGSGHHILELGCGEGHFSAVLLAQGNRVTGVDNVPASPLLPEGLRYIQADLSATTPAGIPELHGLRFDKVLLMDILEHLHDPLKVLAACAALVKPGGEVIVSLPNIANIYIRLSLLMGHFDYTERGILDRTHLHFYTRKSARHFIQSAGYRIEKEFATVIPIELVAGLPYTHPLMRAANRCLSAATWLRPPLFGYQFLFVAVPGLP